MRKGELIEALANKLGTTKKAAEEAIESLVDIVVDEIEKTGKSGIPGLGAFTKSTRKARTGKNPRTGEPISIGPSSSVRFKPTASLKTRG